MYMLTKSTYCLLLSFKSKKKATYTFYDDELQKETITNEDKGANKDR